MGNIQLPKLKPIESSKKKILLLSDDLRMSSGIATISREFVIQTSDVFDWVQLGAALQHPDHGKIFNLSDDIGATRGISDANVKVYAHTGYGNAEVIRELIKLEKPDAILHFTDPRFWEWLYVMEHEIRSSYKIPIMYYNIWDAPPAPFWNKPFYESCDLIMNISKQTHQLVKLVLGRNLYKDLDSDDTANGNVLISYVPHGINDKTYYPISESDDCYKDYTSFVTKFKTTHNVDFVIMWNNRNIRRKNPGDVILAYRQFCEKLSKEEASRVALFMHTSMQDPNGTDIPEVVRVLCPEYKVVFNEEQLPTNVLNYFYNMCDVTLGIASNEGFGLATAESVMAGTPIVVNCTGGLQDQVRFVNDTGDTITFDSDFTSNHTGRFKSHGEWAEVVFPSNRSLQGSLATPYILDDRCDFNEVADKIHKLYRIGRDNLKKRGIAGREWMITKESGMSSVEMGNRMIRSINSCLNEFVPKKRYEIFTGGDREKIVNSGMVWF